MDLETYRAKYGPDGTPGWEAIDTHLAAVLGMDEPTYHFGAALPRAVSGVGALDGLSMYARAGRRPYYHCVSYGMSGLYYAEDQFGGDFSGWGFEFTFRFDQPKAKDEAALKWPIHLLNYFGAYVNRSRRWFEHGHFITAKGPIRQDPPSALTGAIFARDPELGVIDTVHGRLEFLQVFGLTTAEVDALFAKKIDPLTLIEVIQSENPLMITNVDRTKSVLPL